MNNKELTNLCVKYIETIAVRKALVKENREHKELHGEYIQEQHSKVRGSAHKSDKLAAKIMRHLRDVK